LIALQSFQPKTEKAMGRKRILFLSIILFVFTMACGLSSLSPQTADSAPTPEDIYIQLRQTALAIQASDLNIVPAPGSTVPYGVVMDISLDSGTATFVSFISGDGSMYTSTGGGVIGGIGHENVRSASINFVSVAAGYVDQMSLTTDFPLPKAGNIKFYLITPNGVFTTGEVSSDVLSSGNHNLSPLFLAGDDVITAMREISK
jgi:hypothetical protein